MSEIEVTALQRIVEEQANDEGLWFKSVYITESYLQSELRRLHEAAEVVIAASQQGSIVDTQESAEKQNRVVRVPKPEKGGDTYTVYSTGEFILHLPESGNGVMVDREDLQWAYEELAATFEYAQSNDSWPLLGGIEFEERLSRFKALLTNEGDG